MGGRNGELVLNKCKFQGGKKKILDIGGGNGVP